MKEVLETSHKWYTFSLTPNEIEKFETWSKEQEKKVIENQKKAIKPTDSSYEVFKDSWDLGYPYAGAIGGHFSFRFTNTSLGYIVVAIDNITKEECNLTDYDMW